MCFVPRQTDKKEISGHKVVCRGWHTWTQKLCATIGTHERKSSSSQVLLLPLALQPFVGVGFLNQVIPCLPIQRQFESGIAL